MRELLQILMQILVLKFFYCVFWDRGIYIRSVGSKGTLGTPPPAVQILSFSCRIQQKLCQIIGWYTP